MQNREIAIGLVRERLDEQDEKWGSQRKINSHKWHTILSEEVGEVAQAKLDLTENEIIHELIDVAAVALQNVQAILDNADG